MVSNEEVMTFNQMSTQLSAISNQKAQMKLYLEDVKQTIDELDAKETTEVFKNLGTVLIKTTKEKAKKDLKNEMETMEVRIKTLEKQEDIVSKRLEEIKTKIDADMKKEHAKDNKK